jgi:hypothetical protein
MNLSDNSEDSNDEVQYLIPLHDSLYAFASNYISKILTAESIDPQHLHPETRHGHQRLYSIGCANSCVARSIIQSKQILDSIILSPEINKQKVLDHAWSCTEILLNCEAANSQICKETLDLMPMCDAVIEKGKNGTTIPTLPQVVDLENNVAIFLGNAKRFLEKTHEFICIFYGAPNSGANFKAYREWLAKNNSKNPDLIKLLEDDKNWIRQIAFMRNAHEINHAEENFNVEIDNFKLNPGNKCSTPGWRFDFSGRQGAKQTEFSDIVTDMDVYLTNLLTFFEELLMLCIINSTNINYKIKIHKRLPENIDAKCPSMYFVSIAKNR